MNGDAGLSVICPPERQMDDAALVKQFEEDMLPGADGMLQRFKQSEARKELYRRKARSLPAIVAHLVANPPSTCVPNARSAGHWAWCMLLAGIAEAMNNPCPAVMSEVWPWIAWADKYIHAS